MSQFPRYVSAQLHCHSSIEGPASIGAHCYEAKRAGVEVVWLTDHDTRIALCIGGPFVDRFDFESPELVTTVARAAGKRTVQRAVGWYVSRRDPDLLRGEATLSRDRHYTGTQSLCLDVAAAPDDPEWRYLTVDFRADAKLHSRPLLAEPTLGLAVYPETETNVERGDTHRATGGDPQRQAVEPAPGDAQAWLDLILSEQPPDLRQARLRYLLAGATGAADEPEDEDRFQTHTTDLRPPPGTWTRLELHPPEDAAAASLGGVDNALGGVRLGLRVRRGARLRLYIDDLTIAHTCAGNTLHARQRALARALAARHGVVCHVAQEISLAGQHKNAWGSDVPVLDYPGQPGGFTHEHGVAWARQHGAVFSLNHPFSGFNRVEIDDAGRHRAVSDLIESYAGTGASGANTLEVGFPAGRHQFDLDHYLQLWDGLSRRGVIVTGSGSSDAHSARVGWQTGNNFATHIRADSTDEPALLAGLRSGDVYMADPILFRTRLRFRDQSGHHMGQVVATPLPATPPSTAGPPPLEAGSPPTAGSPPGPEAEVELALDQAQPHWRLHWVVDGERRPAIPLAAGPATHRLHVPTARGTFVRAEIWDSRRTPAGAVVEGAAGDAGQTVADGAANDAVGDLLQAPLGGPAGTGHQGHQGGPIGRCIALTNPIWYVPAAEAATLTGRSTEHATPSPGEPWAPTLATNV